jgi:hypothetical protein
MCNGQRAAMTRSRRATGTLVLKDDVLLEIMTSLLPKPEAQFRPLVTKMLSRL